MENLFCLHDCAEVCKECLAAMSQAHHEMEEDFDVTLIDGLDELD